MQSGRAVRDASPGSLHHRRSAPWRHDLEAAADCYAQSLAATTGSPVVLDLVHLGLGDDGHTASLVPGDAALQICDRDVAVSGKYRGYRRMTLTLPILNRARQRLWLVTGAGKAAMLARLIDGDQRIPAGRVRAENSVIFTDHAATTELHDLRRHT